MKSAIFTVLTICTISAFGQVDKEAIRLKVRSHLGEIKTCYEESIKKNPDLEGKVVADFEVNDSGNVQSAKINTSKSSLIDERIHACITGKIKTWKFPATPKGEIAAISYPFIFGKTSK